jgi:hypothetical protein
MSTLRTGCGIPVSRFRGNGECGQAGFCVRNQGERRKEG